MTVFLQSGSFETGFRPCLREQNQLMLIILMILNTILLHFSVALAIMHIPIKEFALKYILKILDVTSQINTPEFRSIIIVAWDLYLWNWQLQIHISAPMGEIYLTAASTFLKRSVTFLWPDLLPYKMVRDYHCCRLNDVIRTLP